MPAQKGGSAARAIVAGCALLLVAPAQLIAQQEKTDLWVPLRSLVGSWEGTVKGQPGAGNVELEIQFVLNGRFLQVKNRTTYPSQEKNPKGEEHQDWGLISYDRTRKAFVFRQFHVEGFVNQYVMDPIPPDGKRFIFRSETIENIPAGWRTRETYRILNASEFVATFELAGPWKDYEIYSESRLKRK